MNDFSERTELLLPEPASALGALLGVPVPDLTRGEGLPLLWHWVYLLDRPAQADLGPDGHPVRGTVSAFAAPGGAGCGLVAVFAPAGGSCAATARPSAAGWSP